MLIRVQKLIRFYWGTTLLPKTLMTRWLLHSFNYLPNR